ncbi:hypothetical protein HMPREF9333_00525 [Johnsonella ignava ATCC 51276]|uniref:Uncharacterized protein n=1 Tax=Johnsonella ignava ATCC 51276 TaxID=679200 RepID=G5GG36_9FIRM|nr:hypothetical protein [Johnsonella ignava]EHI56246.1 hypothetical protein HMPREF9333_00525 [Johnsonella ignava ATCC 51276]
MSGFLGPIHIWLYNKIKFQDGLTKLFISLADEKSYSVESLKEIDKLCGSLQEGELVDLIDGTNIHGWLQERLSLVETRLAYTVGEILKGGASRIEELCKTAFEYGRKSAADKNITPAGGYEYLDNVLLNGMPCDRVNIITSQDDTSISWEQYEDIHRPYWEMLSVDVDNYYRIRQAVIGGIFEDTDIKFNVLKNQNYRLEYKNI